MSLQPRYLLASSAHRSPTPTVSTQAEGGNGGAAVLAEACLAGAVQAAPAASPAKRKKALAAVVVGRTQSSYSSLVEIPACMVSQASFSVVLAKKLLQLAILWH